jgi:hypothetical protein
MISRRTSVDVNSRKGGVLSRGEEEYWVRGVGEEQV